MNVACSSVIDGPENLTKLVPLSVLLAVTFIKRIQFTLFKAVMVKPSSSRR